MRGIFLFVEQLFWTMVWVFLVLILGFWLLGWIKGRDGVLGSIAGWVSSHAEPQA